MYIDGAKKIMGNLKKKNYRYAWFMLLKTVFVLCVFCKIKIKKRNFFSVFPCSPYFLQPKTVVKNYKQTDLIYAYILAQDSYGYMVLVIL